MNLAPDTASRPSYASGFSPKYLECLCPVCNCGAGSHWREVKGEWTRRCADCGHIFAFPMPTEETLLRAYALPPDEFRRFFGSDDFDVHAYEQGSYEWQRDYARQYVATMNRLCPGRGRVLEIGCASGLVLEAAQSAGWETVGVDPSVVASRGVAVDRRLNIHRKSLFEVDLEPESFDLVFAASVIEHLANPALYLGRMRDLLRPGGLLLLAALPNVRAFTIRLGVDRYIGNHPPGHVQFFSKRTIKLLLERTGFTVEDVRVFGMPETVLQLLFGSTAPLGSGSAASTDPGSQLTRARRRMLTATRDVVYAAFDLFEAGSVMEVHARKCEVPDGDPRPDSSAVRPTNRSTQ